jgi:hypothetical protein
MGSEDEEGAMRRERGRRSRCRSRRGWAGGVEEEKKRNGYVVKAVVVNL